MLEPPLDGVSGSLRVSAEVPVELVAQLVFSWWGKGGESVEDVAVLALDALEYRRC